MLANYMEMTTVLSGGGGGVTSGQREGERWIHRVVDRKISSPNNSGGGYISQATLRV